MCRNQGEFSVGEERGPKGTKQNYCKDHLIQIANAVIEKFPEEFSTDNTADIAAKDKKIEELETALKAKTTAHECLKEQLEEMRKEHGQKPKGPGGKKNG
jgi:predicted RNase H-like nuclease (RuvC/YqgF family)